MERITQFLRSAGRGKKYDCVVGVSGGCDSSYMLYLAKVKLGLRPLAVHFDNTWNSTTATENIRHVLDALDIDLYTYVADNREYDDIYRAFLEAGVPDLEAPTDIALAAGAVGVHLTENSLAAEIVRRVFPAGFVIGVSAHSIETLSAAKSGGADFAVFSPVFASPGKGAPVGVEALRAARARLEPFPIIALGGVEETNYEAVLKIADGFAAIRFLNDAENLRKLSEKLNL